MFIEWKKYQEYIEFKSGECSVIFDTKGNTFLKAGKDFILFILKNTAKK